MNDIKMFLKYVIPLMVAYTLSGAYWIIDGFFVGNSVEDLGLSAINIAWPIVSVIHALGIGIGMGGAIHYTINKTEGNLDKANNFMSGTLWMLIISGIIATVFTLKFSDRILTLLGARDTLLSLSKDYISVIALGAIVQVFSLRLDPFIRNYGSTFYSMFSTVIEVITNIILDYLLVWVLDGGLRGAALATVAGNGVKLLFLIGYLARKKFRLRLPLRSIREVVMPVLKIGISPLALQ